MDASCAIERKWVRSVSDERPRRPGDEGGVRTGRGATRREAMGPSESEGERGRGREATRREEVVATKRKRGGRVPEEAGTERKRSSVGGQNTRRINGGETPKRRRWDSEEQREMNSQTRDGGKAPKTRGGGETPKEGDKKLRGERVEEDETPKRGRRRKLRGKGNQGGGKTPETSKAEAKTPKERDGGETPKKRRCAPRKG